jgi:tRNA(His) guanylyltransferase
MKPGALGTRMKRYEGVFSGSLPRRIPVVIRIDGKAFHTLTRKIFGKEYDPAFVGMMQSAAEYVMKEFQGCDFCYGQSDEVSFLLTDYTTVRTQPAYDYDINKLVSISASTMSVRFSNILSRSSLATTAVFDSRAFSVPQDDVANYFLWKQQDATRNAIQMLGQKHFSHRQLHGKSCNEIQEMLFSQTGINFNDCPTEQKRGWCIVDGTLDSDIPIFSQDREYVERHVFVRRD